MAVRFDHLQGVRNHQGHIYRSDRFHVDCSERRPVLRHRGPDAQAARIRGRPSSHQVHGNSSRYHLVSGHRVRLARGHVLVRPQVPRQKRYAL